EDIGLVDSPRYGEVSGIYDSGPGQAIEINLKIDLPSRGPVYPIKEVERLWIIFPKGRVVPLFFSARDDFPNLPHVMRRKKHGPAEICFIREDENDWGIDKRPEDIVKRVREWLADAAAGKLVKPDEHYEPLWIPAKNGLVELDDEEAKNRTNRGEHPWETRAVEISLSGIKYLRVIGGAGTIPATVYYQPNVSDKPWTVLASSPLDVIELASELSWDVQPVIKAACAKSQLSQFLFVFGVHRAKIVNGRQDADEWMACLFIREKTRKGVLVGASKKERKKPPPMEKVWDVKSLPVRSPLTTKLARTTSGWSSETGRCQIAVIGAGALGSKVTDSLARSGLVEILLIDNDLLAPHNLARHTLRGDDLGFYKAKRVASYLNGLYPSENRIVVPYCENFMSGGSRFYEDLKKCKFIVDLSASKAVHKVLSNLRLEGNLHAPIVTAFMGIHGKATFLLIDGGTKEINAEVLEAELISKHLEKKIVGKWLLSGEDTLEAGGGCRLFTTKVPDSLITSAAGWITQNIASLINSGQSWPAEGKIGIMEISEDDSVWSTETTWFNIPKPILVLSSEWKIWIPKRVEVEMKKKCNAAGDKEACGIIVGKFNRQAKMAFVTNAWEPPEDSVVNGHSCQRGRKGLQVKLIDNLKATGDQEGYLGEWHSHPKGITQMSARDCTTSKEMAKRLKEFGIPAILVITNSVDIGGYVITS
ncbi:ThiF family adenylyltransferase, partial [bacterium]|nr:ThiF family adenylyltransferase [bacterium]